LLGPTTMSQNSLLDEEIISKHDNIFTPDGIINNADFTDAR